MYRKAVIMTWDFPKSFLKSDYVNCSVCVIVILSENSVEMRVYW